MPGIHEPISSPADGATSAAPNTPPEALPVAEAQRSIRISLIILTSIVVIGVVTYLGPILKPLLIAVFLYFSMKTVTEVLVRQRLPRPVAYLTVFVSVIVVMTLLFLLGYNEILNVTQRWPEYQEHLLELLGKVPVDASRPLSELLKESSHQTLTYAVEWGVGSAELLIMAGFYLLFLLLGANRLIESVRQTFPGPHGERILAVATEIGAALQHFLTVKTQVSLGLGVTSAILMYCFGVPGWLLWGLLFFAFNYITYIGSIAACIPPIVVAFLDLNSTPAAVLLAILLVVNRFVWIDYVEIKLCGHHLNINSILLFLWLAYWGWVWGVVGLILAFPMIASLKIVLENLEGTKWLAELMSE